MTFTADYFKQAEAIIWDVLQSVKPDLMAAYGTMAYTHKADESVVTLLDKEVEKKLRDALKKFDGTAGILGEEEGWEGNKDRYWVLDPIDGTECFIRGYEVARNHIAYVEDGKVQYSMIYRFPTHDVFTAQVGKGTLKNGELVRTGSKTLDRSWIEMSVDLLDPKIYEAFKRLRPKIANMMVTHDHMLVAEGIIDGLISWKIGPGPWDLLPRSLIFTEAGLRVANVGSETYDMSVLNMVAIHPDNFMEVQKLLSPQA